MRCVRGLSSRLVVELFLLGMLLSCGGCLTSKQQLFSVSGEGWHVQEGQALWRPRKGMPEIGGDVVLATNPDGRFFVQFAKTPMTLVSVQGTPERWLVQFPPKGWAFSGHGRGPARFAWLHLPRALAGKPLPKAMRFELKADGGWRLENTRSGETVEGFLAP